MHRSHRFILEATRDTKKTLYVVAGFYVFVGFALAVISAVNGDRLGTFLGFLIVSGAISAAALIRAVLRIGLRISAISETLEDIRHHLDALSEATAKNEDQDRTRSASDGSEQPYNVREPEGQPLRAVSLSSDYQNRSPSVTSGSEYDPPRTDAQASDHTEIQTRIVGEDHPPQSLEPPVIIDLMSGSPSNPDDLTAAHLDRSAFPRLVTLLEREPLIGPAAAVEAAAGGQHQNQGTWPASLFRPITHDHEACAADTVARKVSALAEAVATGNLRREWNVVCQNGDLLRARRILLALADTLDERELETLQTELDELTDRTEASLRREFSTCAQHRDMDGLLLVGGRIRELLPDRPIADDFARIEPWLASSVEVNNQSAAPMDVESPPAGPLRLIHSAS